MPALSFTLPALAFAAGAYAQCHTTGTLTMTASGDASKVASCSTYSGSIAIGTAVAAISLDGPKRITGNLAVMPQGQLTSFEAADLAIVDGTLSLRSLPSISTFNMPALTEVTQFMMSATGPNLLSLALGDSGLKQVSNLAIDNTYLQNLDGINLVTAGSVSVTNNNYLTDLTMQLRNTTGTIDITGNSQGLNVNLGNLETSQTITMTQISSVDLSSLKNTSGLIAFNDGHFDSLSLPNLTMAGGLTAQGNSALTNISAPLLEQVNSLNIMSNSDLNSVTFPSLERIGAANVTGSFTSFTLPKLVRVLGVFNVLSTKSITKTCSTFASESNKFAITPQCKSSVQNTTPSGSPTDTTTSPSSTPSSAATRFGAPESVYGLSAGLVALLGLLM